MPLLLAGASLGPWAAAFEISDYRPRFAGMAGSSCLFSAEEGTGIRTASRGTVMHARLLTVVWSLAPCFAFCRARRESRISNASHRQAQLLTLWELLFMLLFCFFCKGKRERIGSASRVRPRTAAPYFMGVLLLLIVFCEGRVGRAGSQLCETTSSTSTHSKNFATEWRYAGAAT